MSIEPINEAIIYCSDIIHIIANSNENIFKIYLAQ